MKGHGPLTQGCPSTPDSMLSPSQTFSQSPCHLWGHFIDSPRYCLWHTLPRAVLGRVQRPPQGKLLMPCGKYFIASPECKCEVTQPPNVTQALGVGSGPSPSCPASAPDQVWPSPPSLMEEAWEVSPQCRADACPDAAWHEGCWHRRWAEGAPGGQSLGPSRAGLPLASSSPCGAGPPGWTPSPAPALFLTWGWPWVSCHLRAPVHCCFYPTAECRGAQHLVSNPLPIRM